MQSKTFILPVLFLYLSCNYIKDNTSNSVNSLSLVAGNKSLDANPYKNIYDIPLPSGFTRVNPEAKSFGKWLQDVKLKKDKKVYLFNGLPKHNQAAQFAVLDISIGTRDLQQCADAIIQLRAEYLFDLKEYRAIHFKDNNGTSYRFEKPYTRQNLLLYLQQVYGIWDMWYCFLIEPIVQKTNKNHSARRCIHTGRISRPFSDRNGCC